MGTFATEFNTGQYDSAYPKGIENHYWNIARNRVIRRSLEKHKVQEKRVLEIGCGRGLVVEYLLDNGYDCFGVDLAALEPSVILNGRVQYGIHFSNLPQELRESVEVILLLDVVEHIENTKEFLLQVQSAFPNMQHIFITVPARDELWSNYDTHYGHFRRYTRSSLRTELTAAGMRQLKSSYFFHALYVPALILSLFHIQRSTMVHAPSGKVTKLLHRFIGLCFSLESRLLPFSFFGTSIMSISIPMHD